jgi:sugar phosphate isomerase/epimerase
MSLGLVTYQWGQHWDLPTVLRNCEAAGLQGVELRTEHKHGVEPALSADQRREVRAQFADSPVQLVGYGSNAEFHSPDPAEVRRNVELTKAYIHLMHDCGGSGVKVKPNALVTDVPVQQTLEQIGAALNEVAAYGADYGQAIRLEVHGRGTDELPHIRTIMDIATHPNVGVCWNCNSTDLKEPGLAHNFRLVQHRLAQTVHVRELDVPDYPYRELFALLTAANYTGWILLECRTHANDPVAAMARQKEVFEQLLSEAAKGE